MPQPLKYPGLEVTAGSNFVPLGSDVVGPSRRTFFDVSWYDENGYLQWYYTDHMMPKEHEHMLSALCVVMYYAKRAGTNDKRFADSQRKVRLLLLRAMRSLGLKGRRRVSLRIKHAVYRILDVTRRPEQTEKWLGQYTSIKHACDVGLQNSKLTGVSDKTWAEQIAGRAALMAKKEWPELRDW